MTTRSLVIGSGDFEKRIITEEEYWDNTSAFTPLPGVDAAVAGVAHALRRAGVVVAQPVLHPDLRDANAAFGRLQELAGSDAVIVHFCGHGVVRNDNLYLILKNSVPGSLPATAWKAADLLDRIEDSEEAGPALFLLDVCGAGKSLASQPLLDAPTRKAWVIAACREDEFASDANFSRALTTVLERLAKGWLDFSPELAHVPLDTLAAEIDRELAQIGREGYEQTVVRTPHAEAAVHTPPFIRNPSHTTDPRMLLLTRLETELRQIALATDPGLDAVHFATRAAGTRRTDSCLFSGRTAELGNVQEWLDGDTTQRLMVLHGSPGSGKSALLGLATCILHPRLSQVLRPRMANRVPAFRPHLRAQILAVHARQLTVEQVISALSRQLADQTDSFETVPMAPTDSESAGRAADSAHGMADLVRTLRLSGPTVVIIDALDEAEEPARLLRELVLPLSGHGSDAFVPECRMLIGTRPWWDVFPELQQLVETGSSAAIDLDAQSRDDLARDLEQYLRDFFYFNDCGQTTATAGAIARQLADKAEHGAFLIASLYAEHLLVHGSRTTAAQAVENVPYRITQAFDLQAAELIQANEWIRPVLKALGHARGLGLPLDLIHAVALALQPCAAGELAPEVADTREALHQAYTYLRTSTDTDGRLLYRYFHQVLVDHTSEASEEAVVYEALVSVIPRDRDGRPEWESAHPYLKRHAAAHAAAAGPAALDALLSDPAFLVHADPDELAPQLTNFGGASARAQVRVYRTTTVHHPRRRDPLVRRSLLALDAAAWQNPSLARAFALVPLGQPSTQAIPQWATSRTADSARLHTLPSRGGVVTAIAVTTVGDTPTAFTSSKGGQVLLWDLATGQLLRTLADRDGAITAVATGTLGGHPVAVTGNAFGDGLVWDLATGQRVRLLARLRPIRSAPRNWNTASPTPSAVTAIATATLRQGPAAVISTSHAVTVWDLESGEPLRFLRGGRETGGQGMVLAVATGTLDGRPVALTSGWSSWLLVWDLETGECMNRLATERNVYALATATLTDHQPVAVFAEGEKVIVWDLATGQRVHTLEGHDGPVFTVATAMVHGRPAAITSGKDGQVIVWDLDFGRPVGTLAGHNREVRTIAAGIVERRAVAVTGGVDNLATVWDLELPASSDAPPRRGHTGEVLSVATATAGGRQVVVTCGKDRETIVWDLSTGQRRHTLRGPDEQTNAIATTTLEGRPVAIACGWTGRVVIWDLESGEQVRMLRDDSHVLYALATAVVNERTVAATGTSDGPVIVWDLTTGRRLRILDGHDGLVHAVATGTLTVEGREGCPIAVTSGADGLVIVWDLTTGRRLRTLDGHDGPVYAVATSTLTVEGREGCPIAVTSGADGLVIVWDLTTGQCVRTMGDGRPTVPALVTATVDSRPVAVTGTPDGDVIVWDLATGTSSVAATLPHPMSSAAASEYGLAVSHRDDVAVLAWGSSHTRT